MQCVYDAVYDATNNDGIHTCIMDTYLSLTMYVCEAGSEGAISGGQGA